MFVNSNLNNLKTPLVADGSVSAVQGVSNSICSLSLKAGCTYLLLGHTGTDVYDLNSIMSCVLNKTSGTFSYSYNLGRNSRTIMSGGGGCINFAVVKCQTDCVVGLLGHGYSGLSYNYSGTMVALQLG